MAEAKIVIDVKRTFGYNIAVLCLKHFRHKFIIKVISNITVIKAYNNGNLFLSLKAKDVFGNI